MKTDKTIEMLKQAKKDSQDPAMQKDIDAKIKALETNKTIDK